MPTDWVQSGAVFRWGDSENPQRVLLRDGDTMMCDAWWPHLGNWGFADLAKVRRKRWYFYVQSASCAIEKAVHVGAAPLTSEEETIYRPDLPFAIVRSATTSWDAPAAETADRATILPAHEVFVSPFGPKGGTRPPVRVTADDGEALSVGELLAKSAALQAPYLSDQVLVEGVGIFRLGLERGIPSYYLWGARARYEVSS